MTNPEPSLAAMSPSNSQVQVSDELQGKVPEDARPRIPDDSHFHVPDEVVHRGPHPAGRGHYRTKEPFGAATSITEVQRKRGRPGASLQVVYVGIAVASSDKDPDVLLIGITLHDGTYSIDYSVHSMRPKAGENSGTSTPAYSTTTGAESDVGDSQGLELEDFILFKVSRYRKDHYYKVAGSGITKATAKYCPKLASRMWLEQDIVAFIFNPFGEERDEGKDSHGVTLGTEWQVDEESDSVVRKAIEKFGPGNLPRLSVRPHNMVGVDANGLARINTLADYVRSVHRNTWEATMHFTYSLKQKKIKIAFFNSTPQGGGVALMRHALVRFCRLLGVDCKWYVPRPKPEVFRITKNNHNILQGVDKSGTTLTDDLIHTLDEWCDQNASRYWLRNGGPLMARSRGGADVIIIDDPQMPKLVEIAKLNDPERPVIFRSHIQVRGDLADQPDTPTAGVWNWVWNHVQKCDVFVSHPVPNFVPKNVPSKKVGYLPATTDWLDGLNKKLDDWDNDYYQHEFQSEILRCGEKFTFDYANRKYIVQIARFDPAKGINSVLAAYAELRRGYMVDKDRKDTPQLVIAGHGAVDDPDATPIYLETMKSIRTHYADLEEDIIVIRVGPTDQILNALMANAHVALQLSTREGFEVKVSEALHHGVPIIATKRGGIPLQVKDQSSGYLVEVDDRTPLTVAKLLWHLFDNKDAHEEMSTYASGHVSDEVSTVGNALSWFYLADMLAQGQTVAPDKRWINDMAREEAGMPYDLEHETKLPRDLHLKV